MILANNTLITAMPTLTTSSNNTSDASGLYKSTLTNSGNPTYYFRGNVTNNYVSFAGFTWRVVRINEDGTIRMIMQDTGIDSVFGSSTTDKSLMYYSKSEAKTQLDNWYQTNIIDSGYSNYVANGNYFCEQAKVAPNSTYSSNSGADMIIYSDYTPDFKCEADDNGYGIVNSNIGLITYDEIIFAGGYVFQANSDCYLTNNTYYWTMSPSGLSADLFVTNWYVRPNGQIGASDLEGYFYLYPVINLKTTTPYASGNGTSGNNSYIINN